MRLLLIGTEIAELAQVRNYSGVWSYYLAGALRRRGVDIVFDDRLSRGSVADADLVAAYEAADLTGIDHVVALGNRHFDRVPAACCCLMREKCRGAVTQINDAPLPRQEVDCTFTVRADGGMPGHHHIGWAADPELCRPAQAARELCILIDHPDYVPGRGDRTGEVLASVERFIRSDIWAGRYDAERVRQIVDGGAEDCDFTVRPFNRRHAPYPELCLEYSATHLFMVTHPESVGLTVLETAMAGALPVVPIGFVAPDRLDTVRHIAYSAEIDWPAVMAAIDVEASREAAMVNSWDAIAARICGWLAAFRK